jgi:hypothetical protein
VQDPTFKPRPSGSRAPVLDAYWPVVHRITYRTASNILYIDKGRKAE